MTHTLTLIVIVGTLISSGASAGELRDALLDNAEKIEALKRDGSDLSKPHLIDFFFDSRKPEAVDAICRHLESEGYEPHLERNEEAKFFTCRAVKRTVPTVKTMRSLTLHFRALARQYGGKYHGWATTVEK